MSIFERSHKNPILKPDVTKTWEAVAVFNGCPVRHKDKIYLLYRALSAAHYHWDTQAKLQVSTIGIAESTTGDDFTNRTQFIIPEHEWEKFGCEDPRITKIGDKYYIFYTALSTYPFTADGIKVGLAISKDLKTIEAKHLITPFNAKAMTLFPEKINGQFCAILSVDTDRPPAKIALAYFNKEEDMWSKAYWDDWYANIDQHTINLQRHAKDQIEIGAPPVKTEHGWLLIYSYIRDYFTSHKLFGIEAALLESDNPAKLTARTDYSLLCPEEGYEIYGMVPNIVFPSGVLLDQDELSIYYGATDTFCAVAKGKLSALLDIMLCTHTCGVKFDRSSANPILEPIQEHPWEAKAVFNPTAIYEDGKVHIIYRAMSEDNTSVLGYAQSSDGTNITFRSDQPIYVPRTNIEAKLVPHGNSGCEDPRITKIGDKIYMLYTAYNGKMAARIAITSILLTDFLAQNWNWSNPIPISSPDFDNKDACVLPEQVNGQYMIFHRYGNGIDIDLVPTLDFDSHTWLEENRWLRQRPGMWDSLKVGIAATPLKTKGGWLLLYHGVSSDDHHYRVGAVLLALNDPTQIIGRTYKPLFEPQTNYEKDGQVANVVFPCGAIILDDQLIVYYGGGDRVVGVASAAMADVLSEVKKGY